jgi:hypothetical protein
MKRIITSIAVVSIMAFLFLDCSDDKVAGGGSETDNSALVSGYIYGINGAPVQDAKVRFVPVNHNPSAGHKALAATDSAITDSTGWYGLNTLQPGSYNLLAANTNSSQLAYDDSVAITGDTNKLGTETLQLPGSIRGIVKLLPGDNATTVSMFAFGTFNMTGAELDGSFSFSNLAAGTYRVRISSYLDKYLPLDTLLTVQAGVDFPLVDTIALPLAIPVPKNVKLAYDTLKQIVTLTWDRADTAVVKGYNVYRQHLGSADSLLTHVSIKDTIYFDSTGVQDESYIYRVVSVNLSDELGVKTAGNSITIENAYYVSDTLFTAGGKINAITIDKHGVYVLVRFITANSDPAKIERYSSDGTFLNSWDIPNGIEHSNIFNNIVIDDSNFIYTINNTNQIIKFDDTGAVLNQFQFPGTAIGMGILNDTLYIGDFVGHKIFAYSTRGDSLFSWGGQGFQNGTFDKIVSIICDSSGSIYIEDASDYGRVQVFSRTGVFVRSFSFERFAVANGYTDLIGTQLDNKDSLILVTGSNVYGFSIEGTYIFKYFGLSSPRRALFDAARNIKVALWTGEVVSLGRK